MEPKREGVSVSNKVSSSSNAGGKGDAVPPADAERPAPRPTRRALIFELEVSFAEQLERVRRGQLASEPREKVS